MDREQLRLFVYGSLKRDEYNWHVICDGVEESRSARLAGTMWLRSDGYPALILPETARLGSLNYPADLAAAWETAPGDPAAATIEGELLLLRPGAAWLRRLDEFEGYFPGAASEYLRVLVPLEVAHEGWRLAWTYTAAISHPPDDWSQISSWNRGLAGDLLPYRHDRG